MIKLSDAVLQKAAGEGMDEFIQVFTDKYKEAIGGELTAGTMALLTGEQHSLLAYQIFRDEIMVGGFCQLIQNGYGGYIFDNPFAKVMRLWGAEEFSKLVYKAKKIYDANRKDHFCKRIIKDISTVTVLNQLTESAEHYFITKNLISQQ